MKTCTTNLLRLLNTLSTPCANVIDVCDRRQTNRRGVLMPIDVYVAEEFRKEQLLGQAGRCNRHDQYANAVQSLFAGHDPCGL